MEALMEQPIDPKEMIKFEKKFKQEEVMGDVSDTTKFEYAWCLIRTPYSNDWKTAIGYFKELYEKGDNDAKRDYLFGIALAHYKLKNYEEALHVCESILKFQPHNQQVIQLKELIETTMRKRGLVGMAAVGGASLVVGAGIALLGALVISKKK